MPLACLITILPLDIDSGERVPVRVSSVQDRRVNGLNGVVWEPAITALPSLTINLFNGDFKTPVDPGSATFAINMETVKQSVPRADRYYWQGAPVEIRCEQAGAGWPWQVRFKGIVSSATRRNQTLSITADVDKSTFASKVLTATYAGTGDIEGGSDIKNRLKPLILGYARNVEPILISAAYSIYQFSAYGAIEAITGLYERGSAFGNAVADYPSYADLMAATIPAGRWATCLASGLIRLGAPAYGVITGDVKGYKVGGATPRLTGAIIKAMAGIAGIAAGNLMTASLDALDASVPYPINIVLTDQTSFVEIANQMALACNAQPGISLTGLYFVMPVNLGAAASLTLHAQGRALPQVVNSDEMEVSVPYWKTTMGANKSWRVQTADEIAFTAALIDKGAYSSTETYRDGNMVSLPDGSQWIYQNATPSAGHAPPAWPTASNDWWTNSIPPLTAAALTYADGHTLESLKPAEPSATNGAPSGTPVGNTTADNVANTTTTTVPALSGSLATVAAQMVTVQSNVTAAAATANAASTTATNAANDLAAEISRATAAEGTLSSQIYSLNTSVSGLSASLSSEAIARSNGEASLAASITTVQAFATPNPNLLSNPTGALGLQGWNKAYAANLTTYTGIYGEGNYFYGTATSASGGLGYYQDLPCQTGVVLSISADIFAGGLSLISGTVAQARVYIEWLNASGGHLGYSIVAPVPAGTGWTRTYAPNQVSPAGTATARVWIDIWGDGAWASTNTGWKRIKVEPGASCTAYSDDATPGTIGALVSNESIARQNGYTALAASITSLTSTVNSNTASITSQAGTLATVASATASLDQRLSAGFPNRLKNGSGELGFAYWRNASGTWTSATDARGTFFFTSPGAGGYVYMDSDPVEVWGNSNWICAANSEITQGGGATDGFTRIELLWFPTIADAQAYTNQIRTDYGPNLSSPHYDNPDNRKNSANIQTSPSAAGAVRVRLVAYSSNLVTAMFGAVKFNFGNTVTPYSQEATAREQWVVQQNADASLAASITSLTSSYGSLSSTVSSNYTTLSNAVSTNASAISTVQAQANGLTSTVTSQASAIADLQGRTGAYWSVTAVSGDNRATITLFANSTYAGFDIGGNVRISGNLIVTGSITTNEMQDNAITAGTSAYSSAVNEWSETDATEHQVATATLTTTGKSVSIKGILCATAFMAADGSPATLKITVKRNGTTVQTFNTATVTSGYGSGSGYYLLSSIPIQLTDTPSSGSNTYTIYAKALSPAWDPSGTAVLRTEFSGIELKEFKK